MSVKKHRTVGSEPLKVEIRAEFRPEVRAEIRPEVRAEFRPEVLEEKHYPPKKQILKRCPR